MRSILRVLRPTLAAMATVALLLAPATGTAASRIGRAELRQLLDLIVAAGAPGAAARIVDERGVTQAASGVADQQTGRRMRPGLHYRVGSVTKAYVATVLLQLVGEGRLSLDDTVERWLPGALSYGGGVTVRQLLQHTGGVPDYVAVPYAGLYTDPDQQFRAWAPRELVALVGDRPQAFPPGTAWSYSNTGYVLAGMIVEVVTGNDLAREMKRRIFRPLRLRETSFPVDRATLPRPYLAGYGFLLGQAQAPLLGFTDYNPSFAWAAGAVVSDLGDVQRFFRELLRGRLLSPALLAEMTTSFPTGLGYGYGLGVVVIDTPTGRVFGHQGAIPGYRNAVVSTEDGRRQIVLTMNAEFSTPALSEAFNSVAVALQTRVFGPL